MGLMSFWQFLKAGKHNKKSERLLIKNTVITKSDKDELIYYHINQQNFLS